MNKTNFLAASGRFLATSGRLITRIPIFLILCVTAFACAFGWSLKAQSTGAGGTALTPEQQQQLSQWSITDPLSYNAAVEQNLTQAQIDARNFDRWAISHPADYFQQYVQTDPVKMTNYAQTEFAILHPVEATAQALAGKTNIPAAPQPVP